MIKNIKMNESNKNLKRVTVEAVKPKINEAVTARRARRMTKYAGYPGSAADASAQKNIEDLPAVKMADRGK